MATKQYIAALLLGFTAISLHAEGLRVLHDTDRDGWDLWTAYGPRMNETYGSGNKSKHYHDPAYIVNDGNARILRAVDTGAGQAKRYRSGCLSTREATGGRGFFRFADDIYSIRFEFDVTISEWNHAVWPALWLRGVGGASVHEIDVLEGFTAQTGADLYRIAVHSGGKVNVLRDPMPGTPLKAGQRAVVWAEVFRPGTLDPALAVIKAGVDDTVRVSAPDPHTASWWRDDYGWDMIVQEQIGGNWVGDPDINPYNGLLQNGRTGKPPAVVPSWDGDSSMTVYSVKVVAKVREPDPAIVIASNPDAAIAKKDADK